MIRAILLQPLFNLLLVIFAFIPGNDFGLAVIILTVLIRLALWPLVKKQLYHQKAMKDLQPEIAKVKKKAKGDRTKESQFMVELFKEKGINPFASFGLVILQIPILIALFVVLQRVLDPAQVGSMAYSFVHSLGPVQNIINNPGQFHPTLFGLIDMTEPSIILALLAGLAQFWQSKQITPQNIAGTDPSKKLGFNFTLIFPVVTVAIASQFPAALALYWFFTSLIAVIQQSIVLHEDVEIMRKLGLKKAAKKEPKKEPKEAANKAGT